MREVVDYYDKLAPRYDRDRFGNSYGAFIDAGERAILSRFCTPGRKVLDIGCGTGRLSGHAHAACDASQASVALARKHHPGVQFVAADAAHLPFPAASFDGALCFHVLMHLEREDLRQIFFEVARILVPGGIFVVDIASSFRRGLRPRSNDGWHGNTSLSAGEFERIGEDAGMKLEKLAGIALLPVHRLPAAVRLVVSRFDRHAAALFPALSSYMVGRFVKRA